MKTYRPWMLLMGMACVLAFAMPAVAADNAPGDKEPLKIELPEAYFGGTPLPYESPNLEPEDFRDRPPFMAPKGSALVSKDKPVSASAKPELGNLKMLVDGEKSYASSCVVELPEGLQWVQIDLQSPHAIDAVLLWHFFAGNRVYFKVIVQASNDPDFKTGVTTLYNSDFDNTSGLGVGKDKEYIEKNKGRLIDAKGVTARYIRSYTNGNTSDDKNHYIEMEVFGRPVK
jgi:hypothetical protein